MTRKEFTPKTKAQAFERAGGRCENETCGEKLMPGGFQFDHIHAAGLGGGNELANCKVLCNDCHNLKTHGTKWSKPDCDRAKIAKVKRLVKNASEPRKPGKIQSRGFDKTFKKKLNGKVEKREK